MKNTNVINAENKSVKKMWFKPEITLLDTNNVANGLQSGHFEKNPSNLITPGLFNLHTPGGGSYLRSHSKNFYIS